MPTGRASKPDLLDWRDGHMSREWVPGTEPGRAEPMTLAEVVEVILGFLGIALVVVVLVLLFAQADAPQYTWVHGHFEGTTWVDGHYEGERMPMD